MKKVLWQDKISTDTEKHNCLSVTALFLNIRSGFEHLYVQQTPRTSIIPQLFGTEK